jgi:hypothetical protein
LEELAATRQSITMVSLEEDVECEFYFMFENEKIPVKLKGRIDRTHKLNNRLFIADYKTGKLDAAKDLKLKPDSFDNSAKMNPKLLQLLFYELLYEEKTTEFGTNSGIYALRNPESGLNLLETDLRPEDIKSHTKNLLTRLFTEILSDKTEFMHNAEARYCEFC